ncbi:DUF4132 domain-containing protein [Chitinophaga sp. Cy-1792]|uniref:DUF4132 domain-containing protein n=1 Tax=Chitinophaga sp. Cy-1792 TaxID=2608339 RepID=UPI0014208C5B|nr:DUF4132 domain-containing protein [Chitinophaga sp. Cy-1792]
MNISVALTRTYAFTGHLTRAGKKIHHQLKDEIHRIENYTAHLREEPRDSWTTNYLKANDCDVSRLSYREWYPAYIVHPLTGVIGKQQIWLFSNETIAVAAIWTPEGFTSALGTVLHWIDEHTQVTLWRPADAYPGELAAWQNILTRQNIQQPVPQAFRENDFPVPYYIFW